MTVENRGKMLYLLHKMTVKKNIVSEQMKRIKKEIERLETMTIDFNESVRQFFVFQLDVEDLEEGESDRESTIKTECYICDHKENIPGDCHIKCKKPDTEMTGDEHGIKNNWFHYPNNFDPVWKTKSCDNFELKLKL